MLLSFNIIGLAGLGKDFGGVATWEKHPAIAATHEHMRMLSIFSHVLWLLSMLSAILVATAGYEPLSRFCVDRVRETQARWISKMARRTVRRRTEPST